MLSSYEQKSKETVVGLLNKIFKDSRFSKLKFIIFFSIGISFITLFYDGLLFSCQLSILQNAFLVFISTRLLFSAAKISDPSERIKLGVPIAAILGATYGGVTLLIGVIQYYFFGDHDRIFSTIGLASPQMTSQLLLAGLASQIIIWLLLTLISMFVGFLASITPHRKLSD
jgi:hypothetical protein